MKDKKIIIALILVLVLVGGLVYLGYVQSHKNNSTYSTDSKIEKNDKTKQKKKTSTKEDSQSETHTKEKITKDTVLKEPTVYPDLSKFKNLSVNVSIKKQEIYILSSDRVIFKTSISTGKEDSPTPSGDFVIQAERGNFFYNEESGEGAYYWVSFKDHGVYLFHSLPTDRQGNEIDWEAKLLGKPASHGCIRMPKPTAKWFYESIPQGIPVHIE